MTATPMQAEMYGVRTLLQQSNLFWGRIDPTLSDVNLLNSRILFGDANSIIDGGLATIRPFAVIMRPPGPLWTSYAGGDRPYLRYSGTVWLYFCDTGRAQTNAQYDFLDFCGWCDGVIEEIVTVAGTDIGVDPNTQTLLPLRQVDLVGGPQSPQKQDVSDEQPRWWQVWYALTWGLD